MSCNSETPIAQCSVKGDSSQFNQCFRPFLNDFAAMKFFKVEFTDTSSAGKTARKIKDTSIFRLLTEILIIPISNL